MSQHFLHKPIAAAVVALGLAFSAGAQAQDSGQAASVTQAANPGFNPHGIPFAAGVYKCELNRSVHIRSVAPDMRSAVISWNKKDYVLNAVNALSGALRYEDAGSGLVWLIIVGKSMLLDIKNGKQLANECRA